MIKHHTVIIIVKKAGKFLLVKRLNRPCKGCWCPPSGHVDEGETPFQAAQREANEEVGGVDVVKREIFKFSHDVRIGHRHIAHVFFGYVAGKIKAGSDAGQVKWFTIKEIADLNVAHWTNIVFNRLFPKIDKPDFKRDD